MSLTLHSPAFTEGRPIPRRHTGDGEDVSPPLAWTTLPPGTVELALIVDDPDAPSENPWVHWLLYNIPADETTEGIAGGVQPVPAPPHPAGSVHGVNSWDAPGYRGPAPPEGHGVHHYHFKLYALGSRLGLKPGLDKHMLMNAMSGHILSHGELVGTYQRPE